MIDQGFKVVAAVAKAVVGLGGGGGGIRFHSGGYDTCPLRFALPSRNPPSHTMSRKPQKGYFVKGRFVAEGSELDLQYKAELKGTTEASKTDLKRESTALQVLGKELMGLRSDLLAALELPEKLHDALREAQRITDFEGKRRQIQFIGKLMRKLTDDEVAAIEEALQVQRNGSATEKLALHQAEHWRDRLL